MIIQEWKCEECGWEWTTLIDSQDDGYDEQCPECHQFDSTLVDDED